MSWDSLTTARAGIASALLLLRACLGLADSTVTNGILTVTPASAPQGASGLAVTFNLSSTHIPPVPMANVLPTRVTIGTNTGSALAHPSQYVVTAQFAIPALEATGLKDVAVSFPFPSGTLTYNRLQAFEIVAGSGVAAGFTVVDTGQTGCYNNAASMLPPAAGQPFYGQDAQCPGVQPSYTLSGDGLAVHDNNTGLTWQRSPETSGDSALTASDKLSWADAQARPAVLNAAHFGGYSDWRLPTIKELYSLIDFRGTDPSGLAGSDTSGLTPFIDTNYFQFAYGDTGAGERIIDSQYASSTLYVSTDFEQALFGVNFADGRIKGYGLTLMGSDKTFFVQCVRGNASYGLNLFVDNGDQTITDKATGLMWSKSDSATGLNWSNALAWAQAGNASNYLGHSDWRLPSAKELQSIVDYARSPDTSASAALDPVFSCTAITNEGGQIDYPWFWSGTTHAQYNGMGASGAYVCFGRALGYMNSAWVDIHGAGCQRSDPKGGSLGSYTYASNGYYNSVAPQGDAIRIFNYVRLVRDVPPTTAWRFAFVGDTHTPLSTIASEIAAAVVSDGARLLIVAGDLTQSGAGVSSNTLTSQLTAWRSALAPVHAAGIPVYVVRGNHEDDVPNGLAAWNDFFSGADAMPGNGPAGESNLTYALTCSNALFLGFDNYINIHRANLPWLNQQLAANTLPHIFAFGHEPAFKAFHTDCLDSYPAERNALWSSLAAAGARVYLCGHDHFFNVARVDDGDGNSGNDLYQFIVGTGGSTNWPPQPYSYNGTNAPYSPVNVTNVTATYGYLLVELSGPGANDLGVTLTWKQRTYDTNSAAYRYVAATHVVAYTAVNRQLDSVGDGIPDWWRARHFGGAGTTTNESSCAACDPDGDGAGNRGEYVAGMDPTNDLSFFRIDSISNATVPSVWIESSASRKYTLYFATNLSSGGWTNVPSQTDVPGSGGMDVLVDDASSDAQRFYRVGVELP